MRHMRHSGRKGADVLRPLRLQQSSAAFVDLSLSQYTLIRRAITCLPCLLLEGPGLTAGTGVTGVTGAGRGVTGRGVAGAAGGDGKGVISSPQELPTYCQICFLLGDGQMASEVGEIAS